MRVALLSLNARDGDAIGNQVAAKCHHFHNQGAEVRVYLQSPEKLTSVLQPFARRLSFPPDKESETYLRSCDVIVFEFGQYYELLELLPILYGGKARLVVDYHGITPPELWGSHNREALIRGRQKRHLFWFADQILVHSRYTLQELIDECHVPPERLNQIGFPVMAAKHRESSELRKRLNLDDACVMLYVGRLAPNKNVPFLVDVLHHLRDLTPAVHLVVVGDNSDLYQTQEELCRQRALDLELTDRLHIVGPLVGQSLFDAYRSADVFVTASSWESFCIPVVEAMSWGIPVISTRCGALAETVGNAGLTVPEGDAFEFSQKVRSVLVSRSAVQKPEKTDRKRIALVTDFFDQQVNGVARSLQKIADVLSRSHDIEVFTLFPTTKESRSGKSGNYCIHRFRPEPQKLVLEKDPSSAIPDKLPGSDALIAELNQRESEFHAIFAGPYLSWIVCEVARNFAEKTLLLPCFHDEPAAQHPSWHEVYGQVAGFLFHSTAEEKLAQAQLGFNHPNSTVIGTMLAKVEQEPIRNNQTKFLVYCGRLTREKNVPFLLECAKRYQQNSPGRFEFVIVGEGNVTIPNEPGFRNLGKVSEAEKAKILGQAQALLNFSRNESLSLVALEAWQQGTPVIAHQDCEVLRDHVQQSQGGEFISDYSSFVRVLNDLYENPQRWQNKGKNGQTFVSRHYSCVESFTSRLESALAQMDKPLCQLMQDKGLQRAQQFTPEIWQQQFSQVVDKALHTESSDKASHLVVRPRVNRKVVRLGGEIVLIPVRVKNKGSVPAFPEGPQATEICAQIRKTKTERIVSDRQTCSLSGLVLPGKSLTMMIPLAIPQKSGKYTVAMWARPTGRESEKFVSASFPLIIKQSGAKATGCGELLDQVHKGLDEAQQLETLPEDYLDLTQGLLAGLKHRIKKKLLHNFKVAYIDVLSRQQSAFNRQMLSLMQELVECCTLLDHSVQLLLEREQKRSPSKTKSR